jgi:opacity protein-like surface antigen
MKRISLGVLALAVALGGTFAAPLPAQLIQRTEGFRFGLGLGATLPMGDYGSMDKMGINLLGVFEAPLAHSPLYLRADGLYSSTSHETTSGNTSILGGTVSALYHFSAPAAEARPYALAGLGIYNFDGAGTFGSQTKIGIGVGGGVTFNLSGLNAFAEARYISIQTGGGSASLVPLTVGLMFNY